MNRFAIVRAGVVHAIFADSRSLEAVREAFADIAKDTVAAPMDAQCGWLFDGRAFSPPQVNDVPLEVTNFQARAALLGAGLFETVDAAVRAQGPNSAAFQAWEYANHLTRNGALVNSMGKALGLTDADLDALFRAAAKIEA